MKKQYLFLMLLLPVSSLLAQDKEEAQPKPILEMSMDSSQEGEFDYPIVTDEDYPFLQLENFPDLPKE